MRVDLDLSETQGLERMLRRWGTDATDSAHDGLRDAARLIADRSAVAVLARPGGGTYKRDQGAYRARKIKAGAQIRIQGPTAVGAEYGTNKGWVFGRVVKASTMRRRQYAPWVRTVNAESGYVVGATLKSSADDVTDETIKGADRGMRHAARRSGVDVRGRAR